MSFTDFPPVPTFTGSVAINDAPLDPEYIKDDLAALATLLNGGLTNSHFSSATGDALSGQKIGAGTITGDRMAALTIAAAYLGTDSVTTAKILDANVTLPKLASGITTLGAIGFTYANATSYTLTTAYADTIELDITTAANSGLIVLAMASGQFDQTSGYIIVEVDGATIASSECYARSTPDNDTFPMFAIGVDDSVASGSHTVVLQAKKTDNAKTGILTRPRILAIEVVGDITITDP